MKTSVHGPFREVDQRGRTSHAAAGPCGPVAICPMGAAYDHWNPRLIGRPQRNHRYVISAWVCLFSNLLLLGNVSLT